METVLVQIMNRKALKLLQDLEELNLIKVLQKSPEFPVKLSEKYAGKLSSQVADELNTHITQSRNEWPNIWEKAARNRNAVHEYCCRCYTQCIGSLQKLNCSALMRHHRMHNSLRILSTTAIYWN
jgi:hypothetical protein